MKVLLIAEIVAVTLIAIIGMYFIVMLCKLAVLSLVVAHQEMGLINPYMITWILGVCVFFLTFRWRPKIYYR